VFVTANQKEGTNIFEVFKKLRTSIEEVKKHLPDGMRLEVVFDQSKSVADRVNGFLRNLVEGILLVGIVLLFADSSRASAHRDACHSAVVHHRHRHPRPERLRAGASVHRGLVIALGMLVDDAIVVTDNISRFRRSGSSDRDASILGTNQVGWAVTSFHADHGPGRSCHHS